jgi:hypothetical protein
MRWFNRSSSCRLIVVLAPARRTRGSSGWITERTGPFKGVKVGCCVCAGQGHAVQEAARTIGQGFRRPFYALPCP